MKPLSWGLLFFFFFFLENITCLITFLSSVQVTKLFSNSLRSEILHYRVIRQRCNAYFLSTVCFHPSFFSVSSLLSDQGAQEGDGSRPGLNWLQRTADRSWSGVSLLHSLIHSVGLLLQTGLLIHLTTLMSWYKNMKKINIGQTFHFFLSSNCSRRQAAHKSDYMCLSVAFLSMYYIQNVLVCDTQWKHKAKPQTKALHSP